MPKLNVAVNKAIRETVREVIGSIEAQAKLTAPVDTGYYRAQIKANYVKDEVVAHANYSAALEYGVKNTRRQPRPTMRNAARAVAKKVPEIFKRKMNNV